MVSLLMRPGLLALAAWAALAGGASAQSMGNDSASYNAGYGRVAGQENQPVAYSLRDANGNLVVVDGVIDTGQGSSVFGNASASGVANVVSGVASSTAASAVANNLQVVTQGNYNTVIVNSTQNNSGNVTANASVAGGVGQ